MNRCPLARAVILSWALLFSSNGVVCRADEPVFVNRAFIGENFFVGLFPNTTQWLSLEGSFDLKTWTNVASVATTNAVTIIHDPDARAYPQRFYRLRSPGFSVEDAEAKWDSQIDGAYQFSLEHRVGLQVFTGMVTITNGQKRITDAAVNGQPLEEPDPAVYLSVEEMFTLLREAQLVGCHRVAAIYEVSLGYPTWCVVEHPPQYPDEYHITELSGLGTDTGG